MVRVTFIEYRLWSIYFVPTQYCNADFLWYFLHSYDVINGWISAKTSTNGNIKNSNILDLICPLPPLAEQKRIVAKIEELMPFVEQYATVSTKLNTLNASFPEMMKKSILQEAVQGKLVPQDPSDEPASLLLKKIAEEKKRLIKEGKIKKQKPLPEITEDEIPFDIPESWEWVRLGNLAYKITDGTHKTPKYKEDGVKFVSAKSIYNGRLTFDGCKFISKDEHVELFKRCNPEKNDILISKSGSIGTVVVNPYDFEFSMFESLALIKFSQLFLSPRYLKIAIQYMCYSLTDKEIKGVAVKHLPIQAIKELIIPIPPKREQGRIVDALETVFTTISCLDNKSVYTD